VVEGVEDEGGEGDENEREEVAFGSYHCNGEPGFYIAGLVAQFLFTVSPVWYFRFSNSTSSSESLLPSFCSL